MAAPRERVPVSAATLLRSLKPRSSTELGTLRQSLRTEIAQATGARHVFLTGSARLGILWLLEEAVNRHGGGEALLWNYNFFAVPQAAEAAGLTPVFVDSANTWGEPTLEAMHASCTPKTRALLVSHHFGRPSNMDVWCQFAEERNLAIVEDCAHAFASKYDGTSVGLFGLGGVFSLSLTKTLTGVAGGAIITNDDEVAAHLAVKEAALAEPAADAVAKSVVSALAGKILLSRPTYSALFHTGNRVAAGFGSDPIDTLMTEPVPADGEMPPASSPTRKALAGPYASIARTHLTTVATEVAERRDCAHALIEAAQAAGVSENLQFPARETDRTNTFLNFVVRSEQPKALRARLLSAGFDTRRDYILPMNRDDEQFPHSNELTRTGVYLPVRSLRTAEIGKLVQALARVVLALLVMASGACEDAPEESTEGTEETEDPTVLPDQTIAFTNVAPLVGLSGFQDDPESCQTEAVLERVTGCYIEGWTGGVAVGDFDGDTLTDLYFPRIGAADSLFRNLGDGTFEDVAESVGVGIDVSTNGAAFADIDNDGDLDLIVTVLGGTGHLLFVNYDGVFVEEGQERGLADLDGLQFGTTPAFGDYDRDGYVDLYIANQTPPNQEPAIDTVVASQLYRNAGVTRPGFFENSTVAAGVGEVVGGFAPSFVDLDDDGWLDLQVVAIDGSSRLFWNEAGAFVDGSGDAGIGTSGAEMGSTFGDYDGDGDLDWFVAGAQCSTAECGTNREFDYANANRLYRNDGDRSFSDQTEAAGMRVGYLGWGSAFFDSENDGDLDLVQTNGWAAAARLPNEPSFYAEAPTRFWRNNGEFPWSNDAEEVGLDFTQNGHGLAVFDYENDGDLDLVVAVSEGEPMLLRNIQGGDWLRVRTSAEDRAFEALGARVTVSPTGGSDSQVRQIGASTHYLGQSERVAHFGLGEAAGPVDVTIRWPRTGVVTTLESVEPNQVLTLVAPAEETAP